MKKSPASQTHNTLVSLLCIFSVDTTTQLLDIMDSVELPHTLAHTPEMEILQKLMDFDDRGRYISLNAIANKIRYI